MFDHNQKINHAQKAFTAAEWRQLVKNHEAAEKSDDTDFKPVAKWFGGCACTWLIVSVDPETGVAFGLADLGAGSPELGYFDLNEIISIRFPPLRTRVERDLWFSPTKKLTEYADDARKAQRITV